MIADENRSIRVNRTRSRVIAFLGIAMGALVVYVNPKYFSDKIDVSCTYWLFWSVMFLLIFLLYMVFLSTLRANIIRAKDTIHPGGQMESHKLDLLEMYFEGGITATILFGIFSVAFGLAAACYWALYL